MSVGRAGFISTKLTTDKVLIHISSEYVAEMDLTSAIARLQNAFSNIK